MKSNTINTIKNRLGLSETGTFGTTGVNSILY